MGKAAKKAAEVHEEIRLDIIGPSVQAHTGNLVQSVKIIDPGVEMSKIQDRFAKISGLELNSLIFKFRNKIIMEGDTPENLGMKGKEILMVYQDVTKEVDNNKESDKDLDNNKTKGQDVSKVVDNSETNDVPSWSDENDFLAEFCFLKLSVEDDMGQSLEEVGNEKCVETGSGMVSVDSVAKVKKKKKCERRDCDSKSRHRCSRCKTVSYCCQDCLTLDWCHHRDVCNKAVELQVKTKEFVNDVSEVD